MSAIYNKVYSCLQRGPTSEQTEIITDIKDVQDVDDIDDLKENDAPELSSDKKTDQLIEPAGKQPGIIWRVGSGLYNTTTGAVGYGFGGIKWVAGAGYSATTAVGSVAVNTGAAVVKKVKAPLGKKKAKDD